LGVKGKSLVNNSKDQSSESNLIQKVKSYNIRDNSNDNRINIDNRVNIDSRGDRDNKDINRRTITILQNDNDITNENREDKNHRLNTSTFINPEFEHKKARHMTTCYKNSPTQLRLRLFNSNANKRSDSQISNTNTNISNNLLQLNKNNRKNSENKPNKSKINTFPSFKSQNSIEFTLGKSFTTKLRFKTVKDPYSIKNIAKEIVKRSLKGTKMPDKLEKEKFDEQVKGASTGGKKSITDVRYQNYIKTSFRDRPMPQGYRKYLENMRLSREINLIKANYGFGKPKLRARKSELGFVDIINIEIQ